MLASTRKCFPQVTRKSHANDSQMSASIFSLAGVLQVSCNCHSYILFHLESDRERSHGTSLSWKFLLDPIYQSSQWLVGKLSKLWHEIVKFNSDFPRDFSNICINTLFQMNRKKFNKHHLYTHGAILSPYMMSMVSLSGIYFLYPSESERERLKSLTLESIIETQTTATPKKSEEKG